MVDFGIVESKAAASAAIAAAYVTVEFVVYLSGNAIEVCCSAKGVAAVVFWFIFV